MPPCRGWGRWKVLEGEKVPVGKLPQFIWATPPPQRKKPKTKRDSRQSPRRRLSRKRNPPRQQLSPPVHERPGGNRARRKRIKDQQRSKSERRPGHLPRSHQASHVRGNGTRPRRSG